MAILSVSGGATIFIIVDNLLTSLDLLQVVSSTPFKDCIVVNEETLDVLLRSVEWQNARKSMRFHIDNFDVEGVSALHLGLPYCYMMLSAMNGTGVFEMYNPEFMGYSPALVVERYEESLSCPSEERRPMIRSNHVLVSYFDAQRRTTMHARFDDREAWAVQHVGLHSIGFSICSGANNVDSGVETLRGLLTGE